MNEQKMKIEDFLKKDAVNVETEFRSLSQSQIAQFATITDDNQWIHIDAARCALESPFKVPIAHGFLVLSFVSSAFFEKFDLGNFRRVINYGVNRVRFPDALRADDRYKIQMKPKESIDDGQILTLTFEAIVSRPGGIKPVCIAEVIFKLFR